MEHNLCPDYSRGGKNWKSKQVAMPYLAGALNFAWEINAVIGSSGMWGRVMWAALDCAIVVISLHALGTWRKRCGYVLLIVAALAAFSMIFRMGGMLISSFVIDFEMAIVYIWSMKKLSPSFKLPIAVTKLLGDVCAGLYYARYSTAVMVLAILTFLANLFYLCYCIEFAQRQKSKKYA